MKKTFDIVYIEFYKNTEWANGLHIIIRELGDCFEICNVTGDGKPELYENGKFKTGFVNKKWKGIRTTSLKLFPSKEDCKNNDIKNDTITTLKTILKQLKSLKKPLNAGGTIKRV